MYGRATQCETCIFICALFTVILNFGLNHKKHDGQILHAQCFFLASISGCQPFLMNEELVFSFVDFWIIGFCQYQNETEESHI